MRMHFETGGDGFYVENVCAVYRWYSPFMNRAGTYRVIALNAAFELIKFYSKDGLSEEHPTCVVDDFGSLVKVPA